MVDKLKNPTLYEEFVSEFYSIIENELPKFKDLGIKDLGFRRFYKNGLFMGYTTNSSWMKFEYSNLDFTKVVAEYFKDELNEAIQTNKQFFLRTGDVTHQSKFLKKLYEFGMWNSLALYKVDSNKIDGYYFISSVDNYSVVANYINNLDYLRNFISIISPKIDKIYSCSKYQKISRQLLDPSFEANFSDNKFQIIKTSRLKLTKNGKLFLLSKREIECLVLLSGGNSVKQIANLLKISPKTIDSYIISLKTKISATSRADLIKFAFEMQLSSLLK